MCRCFPCRALSLVVGALVGIAFLVLNLADLITAQIAFITFAVAAALTLVFWLSTLPFLAYIPEGAQETKECVCRGAVCSVIAIVIGFVASVIGLALSTPTLFVLTILLFLSTGSVATVLTAIAQTIFCLLKNCGR